MFLLYIYIHIENHLLSCTVCCMLFLLAGNTLLWSSLQEFSTSSTAEVAWPKMHPWAVAQKSSRRLSSWKTKQMVHVNTCHISHKFLEIVDCVHQLLKVFGISWMRYWSFSCWRMRSVLSLGSLCLALMMAASCDSTAFCDWCVSLAWPACDSADPCHGVYAGDSPTSHKHAIT